MKKLILSTALLALVVLSVTSCQRRCRGGGWYGNRNLGYVPEKPVDQINYDDVAKVEEEIEDDCQVTR